VTPFLEDAQPGDKVMCQDEHRNDTSGATGPIRGRIDRKAEPKCMDPFNRRLGWGARLLDLQLPRESCGPPSIRGDEVARQSAILALDRGAARR